MRPDGSPSQPARETALARVVALEQQLDDLLRRADAEAEAEVQAAHQWAQQRLGDLERELAQVRCEIETRLAAEREARLRDLRERADGQLAALAGLDETALQELAEWVVLQVLAGGNAADQ